MPNVRAFRCEYGTQVKVHEYNKKKNSLLQCIHAALLIYWFGNKLPFFIIWHSEV